MKKLLPVTFGLAFYAGCTVNATGPSKETDDTLKTRDSFCKAWAQDACNADVVDACGAKDADDCVAAQRTYCTNLLPVGYDSTNAEECLTAVKRAFADAELNKAELDLVLNLGGECGHLIKGPSAEGDSCMLSTECNTVKGYSCVIKAGDPSGTCQIPMLQGPGEPCDAPSMLCDTGAYCDGDNCLVTKPEGKACNYDAMCGPTDLCDFTSSTDDGVTGKCAPKLAKSDDCTANSECASGICLTSAVKPKCVNSIILTPEASMCTDLGG